MLHPNVNPTKIIIHPRNLFEVTNTLSRFFLYICQTSKNFKRLPKGQSLRIV